MLSGKPFKQGKVKLLKGGGSDLGFGIFWETDMNVFCYTL